MITTIRWNAHGQRYVVGKDQHGKVGLFADMGNGHWRPFDEEDLRDCRMTLECDPSEVLLCSIYRESPQSIKQE